MSEGEPEGAGLCYKVLNKGGFNMLRKQGSRFVLYPYKVKYTQRGETYEQWALPNKEWWEDFADRWEHTDIIEFIEIELTEEQQKRFSKVEYGISEGFVSECIEYILEGKFPEGFNHPLLNVQLFEKDKKQDEDIDIVAETAVYANMDIEDLAEMLLYALSEIKRLEGRIDG